MLFFHTDRQTDGRAIRLVGDCLLFISRRTSKCPGYTTRRCSRLKKRKKLSIESAASYSNGAMRVPFPSVRRRVVILEKIRHNFDFGHPSCAFAGLPQCEFVFCPSVRSAAVCLASVVVKLGKWLRLNLGNVPDQISPCFNGAEKDAVSASHRRH
jgi:hypothetical protein